MTIENEGFEGFMHGTAAADELFNRLKYDPGYPDNLPILSEYDLTSNVVGSFTVTSEQAVLMAKFARTADDAINYPDGLTLEMAAEQMGAGQHQVVEAADLLFRHQFISLDWLTETFNEYQAEQGIDRDADEDPALELADTLADLDELFVDETIRFDDDTEAIVDYLLRQYGLSERDVHILQLKYRDGLTFKQVGSIMGVTASAILQSEERAIRYLRTSAAANRIIEMGLVTESNQTAVGTRADLQVPEVVSGMMGIEEPLVFAKKVARPVVGSDTVSHEVELDDSDDHLLGRSYTILGDPNGRQLVFTQRTK